MRKVAETPRFRELADQARDELVKSGRTAVRAAADRTMGSYADALHRRTEELRRREDGGEREPERDGPEREEPEDTRDAEDAGNAEGKPRRPHRTERTARRPHHTMPADREDASSDRAAAEKPSHRTGHRR